MNQQKLNNIFALESKERYGYLLRKVADFETIYLITDKDDQFVYIGSTNASVLPVWPEKEFAALFLTDTWKDCKVVEYNIHDFIDWLNELEKEKIDLAGFPNLGFNTIQVSAIDMKNHLIFELSQYE
jgi:hypothetical protein